MMNQKKTMANIDFIPLALFELGGVGQYIDVEDVFFKCYELSPERFGWRKYQYPNYKILYQSLIDFEIKLPELIIKTSDGLSRQLSAEGVEWLNNNMEKFKDFLDIPELITLPKRPHHRILNEISKNDLFIMYSEGISPSFNKYVISDLLLCSPDSSAQLLRERLDSYRSAAKNSNREDIVRFFDYLLNEYPEWFGGG